MTINYEFYATKGDKFFPRFSPEKKLGLDAGIYEVGLSMEQGIFFSKLSPKTDELIEIPNSVSETIVKDIEKFLAFETKERFKQYGLVHKRGILMHGPGGTGKTSTIAKISEKIIALGGIALFGPPPELVSTAIKAIKDIQPDIPILIIYEELETWLSRNSHEMLSLLDGELQNDGVVILATTNYITRIPSRVKNRPSRFALSVEVGMPTKEFRHEFFKQKLKGRYAEQLAEFVDCTEGFVVDQMKDVVVSVCCLEQNLNDVVMKINTMAAAAVGVDDYYEEQTQDIFSSSNKGNKKGNPFTLRPI